MPGPFCRRTRELSCKPRLRGRVPGLDRLARLVSSNAKFARRPVQGSEAVDTHAAGEKTAPAHGTKSESPMTLIECPACGRQISAEANACPQCGHPNRAAGLKCYACAVPATTRCQSCGALSCVRHVQSIYVSHGEGGANELRCETCYSSAEARTAFERLFVWIALAIGVVIIGCLSAR